MITITARNVNGMWDSAKTILNQTHVTRPSRVGYVWEYPRPVTSEYLLPTERVLFNPERNANCFFNFFEALWMLAGRRDVAWLEQFNSRIKEFVGPGPLLHDAYGHRWRFAFDLDGGAEDGYADQLPKIVRMLKKSPDERRAVLCMWNPVWDLERPDQPSVPCNTQIYFKIREGRLTMTVCCRSNDLCLGAYNANCVHMSMLQEYVAAMIGVPVGTYWQISDSWHAYTARWTEFGGHSGMQTVDYYAEGVVKPFPMVEAPETFDAELFTWVERASPRPRNTLGGIYDDQNSFFPSVATPLLRSWRAYKIGDISEAVKQARICAATDWSLAAQQWLDRVATKRRAKMEAAI